jgi:hypothetical protein
LKARDIKAIDFTPGDLYDAYGDIYLVLSNVPYDFNKKKITFLFLKTGKKWTAFFYAVDPAKEFKLLSTSE